MTLNASGPISLGGATVGQSINLELGQSATAQASINATNFRTLAGVASGTIALSNFYGKSNSTSWVLYLGQGQSSRSTSSAIGTVYWDYRWCAGRNSGTVAIGVNSRVAANVTFGIKWISSAGVVSGSVFNGNANNAAQDPAAVGKTFSVTTDKFVVLGNNTAYINAVNANGTSYLRGSEFQGYTTLGGNTSYPNTTFGNITCTDSSGNFYYVSGTYNKGSARLAVAKYTSSVNFSASLIGPNHSSTDYINSVYPRSDGTIVAFGASGSNSTNQGRAIFYNSAITSVSATYNIYNYTGMSQFYTTSAFDNVNNIAYMRGYNGVGNSVIARFDSSFNCTAQVEYYDSTDGYDMQSGGTSISYYGGYLYMVACKTGSPSFTILTKINPTTLAVVWAAKYAWGSSKSGIPPYQFVNLYATANGVYFMIRFNSTNETYLFNISGDAAPTATTVNIPSAAGGTYSLTVSSVTVTATSLSTWTTASTSETYTATGTYTPGWNITTGTVSNGVSSTLVSL